jgi:hypothetical protein
MNEQSDSSLVLVEFLEFLKGKNEKEMGDLYRSLKKIEAEKQNQKLCRTWSLTEYDTHLSTVLTEVNMKIFLEYSKCRHVYMALYPDDELAKWLEIEKPDDSVENSEEDKREDKSDEKSEEDSEMSYSGVSNETQIFFCDLIHILKKIITSNKNPIRQNFFTFLDVCWQAINFDIWGKGNIDRVVDESKKKINPSHVRRRFINYIKAFLTKEKLTENSGGSGKLIKTINDAFKGYFQFLE